MKLFKHTNKDGHTDRRTKSAPVARKTFKDYLLLTYVLLTVMGVYSAAIFYLGTQYTAHADSSHVTIIKTNVPKK